MLHEIKGVWHKQLGGAPMALKPVCGVPRGMA